MKTNIEDIKRKIESYKKEIAKLESELNKYNDFTPMVAAICLPIFPMLIVR